MLIQLCLKEYLRFHRYLNTTCMFTKVQNINMEFANVRVKRNWCTPYLISRKLAVPSSGMHFSQHIVHQRQVFEIIDPFLIQPIIPIIYNGCGVTSHFYPALHIFAIFFQIIIDSLQSCALFIKTSQRKSRARK